MNSKKQNADNLSVASSRQSKRSRSSVRFQKKNKFRAKRAQSLAHHQKMRKVVQDIGPAVKQLDSSRRKLTLAKEGWLDAKDTKDSKVDVKVLQAEVDMMIKEIALAKDTLRAGYANKPFKVGIWRTDTSVSTQSAALTAVITLDLTGFTEWSSLIALFDLGRCTGLTIHTACQGSHATAAPELYWTVAYDPGNSGTFGSLTTALASVYKVGLKKMAAQTALVATSPSPVDQSGLYKWRVGAMPPIVPDQSTALTQYTGDWFDTVNSSIIVGYLKPYVSAGSGVTTALTHYVEAHMEFKMRS